MERRKIVSPLTKPLKAWDSKSIDMTTWQVRSEQNCLWNLHHYLFNHIYLALIKLILRMLWSRDLKQAHIAHQGFYSPFHIVLTTSLKKIGIIDIYLQQLRLAEPLFSENVFFMLMWPSSGFEFGTPVLYCWASKIDLRFWFNFFSLVYEIKNVIFEIQRYENLSCLALFILTHGEENGLLFGRDTNYRLNKDIVNELLPQQCASLAGKPKLIFVQVKLRLYYITVEFHLSKMCTK